VHRSTSLLQDFVFLPGVKKCELEFRKIAEDVIDLLDLQSYRDQVIANLPYGVRKIVEVARALCMKPKLLLLDEPSSGLNPEETEDLSFWLEDINEELGITVIMVEHDMKLVSQSSHRVLAVADGHFVALGTVDEIQNNAEVRRVYLGGAP
jgi:branched-chain amino acid transport system ATP-binding protein